MKRKKIVLLYILGTILLTGCASGETLAEMAATQEYTQATETMAPTEAPTVAPTPEPTEAPTPEPTPKVVTFTLSAAGDVTLGNMHLHGYEGTFNEMYDIQDDPAYFFENVRDIFEEDDMTLVNFEGVLTTSDERVEKAYNMKGDPEYVKILTEGSVEAVSMGNNHRMDYGEQGEADTVAALESEGIAYAYDNVVGLYKTEDITVGFVSVNEHYDGDAVEVFLKDGIKKLKEEQVNLIIACCHWGEELAHYPNDYQKELGKKCINWGADLVIGHHPHVLQGIEEYRGKYIIYSLGNFCFGGNRNPKDKEAMIFQQTFTFVDGVKQEDQDIQVIPCTISSVMDRNDYQPTPVYNKDAERIIDRLNTYSEPFGIEFDYEGFPVREKEQEG